jgi:imidazolonepropionase-like amidohydrolase
VHDARGPRQPRTANTLWLLALGLVLVASCGGGNRDRGDLLVSADRLFDGRRFHEPGAVLVRGGRIFAVGGSLDADAERTIDVGDATILPGFIDLHVHEEAGLLLGGVTTARNLGSTLAYLLPPGRYAGLRLVRAGPIVSVAGGYPETIWGPAGALNVRDPLAAREAVRLLVRGGAAVIKISLDSNFGQWPMLSVAQVRAIVDEAHARRRGVTAHAVGPDGVQRALTGGVDELAHAPCGATDEQLRRLAEREIAVVATLHVWQVHRGGCADVASRFVALGGELLYGRTQGTAGSRSGSTSTSCACSARQEWPRSRCSPRPHRVRASSWGSRRSGR